MRQFAITGVSTGIGHACASVLIERGSRVFGSVRTQADAERLRGEFGERLVPLLFDVTDEPAVQRAAETVARYLESGTLDGLINNAGIEITGPMAYLATAEFRHQLEVNLIGPFIVTKAFLPLLGADLTRRGKPGRIVNISSTSGRIAAPFTGAYAASKFGLEGYSESLRRELILFGIDVIIIRPGAVVTPIWQKSEAGVTDRFRDTPFADALAKFESYSAQEATSGLDPEVIGQAVWRALTSKRPKVRFAIVPKRFVNWILPRLIPLRALDKLISQFFGVRKRKRP